MSNFIYFWFEIGSHYWSKLGSDSEIQRPVLNAGLKVCPRPLILLQETKALLRPHPSSHSPLSCVLHTVGAAMSFLRNTLEETTSCFLFPGLVGGFGFVLTVDTYLLYKYNLSFVSWNKKECKSAMRCCLLDMARLSITSCVHLHKIKPVKIPVWIRRGS